jgi:hypothetical protein
MATATSPQYRPVLADERTDVSKIRLTAGIHLRPAPRVCLGTNKPVDLLAAGGVEFER